MPSEGLFFEPSSEALEHAALGEPRGHRDAALDGLRRRPAVADERQATYAEQQAGALLGVVHALPEPRERPPREQRADLRHERGAELLAQHLCRRLDQALADLERDVAREAVAHDHVGAAREELARLEVADEVQGGLLEQRVRLADQVVALARFLANRQQPDTRPVDDAARRCA